MAAEPGDGSAAAYAGAMGAGLVAMVAGLTIGKKKYADVEAEMQAIRVVAENLRKAMDGPPDVILSGVNRGANLADDITYSGTVSAAIEGALAGIRSIALSQVYAGEGVGDAVPFDAALAWGARVLAPLLDAPLPRRTLVNINFPALPADAIKGIRVVPQNIAAYVETYDRRVDPRGRVYFWSGPDFRCPDPHPDTDVTALAEGYITVTPLQFNLTHAGMLERMQEWKLTLP